MLKKEILQWAKDKGSKYSACIDLYANEDVVIMPL